MSNLTVSELINSVLNADDYETAPADQELKLLIPALSDDLDDPVIFNGTIDQFKSLTTRYKIMPIYGFYIDDGVLCIALDPDRGV